MRTIASKATTNYVQNNILLHNESTRVGIFLHLLRKA